MRPNVKSVTAETVGATVILTVVMTDDTEQRVSLKSEDGGQFDPFEVSVILHHLADTIDDHRSIERTNAVIRAATDTVIDASANKG